MGSFSNAFPLSEYALTLEFGKTICEENRQKVERFNQVLLQYPFPGLVSTIPAYASLTILYDPLKLAGLKASSIRQGSFEKVLKILEDLDEKEIQPPDQPTHIKEIPMVYGGIWGPDLEFLAHHHAMHQQDIIQIHSGGKYRVFMMGFIPGFAYLGGLDERLISPRKLVPREQVLPGSVGIAGAQTGIYPLASPGGWQIIGRTPVRLFDPQRSPASWLKAGDWVQFKPISESEYHTLAWMKE